MNISFTKFNTVKINGTDEITNDYFFNKMSVLIKSDIEQYQVIYDKKNNRYYIRYGGKLYDVMYGNEYFNDTCKNKDIVMKMSNLLILTNNTLKIKKNTKIETKNESNERKKIFSKVRKGINLANESYEKKVKLLRKDYLDSKKNILLDAIKNVIKLNYDYIGEGYLAFRFFTPIFSIVIGLACLFTPTSLPTWFAIILGISAADGLTLVPFLFKSYSSKIYLGLYTSILSILYFPINIIINIVKTFIKKINVIHEKSILKKNYIDLNETKKILLNSKNLDEIKEVIKSNDNNEIIDLSKLSLELKDLIVSIHNNKTKKELAKELYEMLNDYFNSVASDEIRNDLLKDRLNNLKIKIEEVNEDEKERISTKESYEMLMTEVCEKQEEISHTKSIGSRG